MLAWREMRTVKWPEQHLEGLWAPNPHCWEWERACVCPQPLGPVWCRNGAATKQLLPLWSKPSHLPFIHALAFPWGWEGHPQPHPWL